MQVEILIDTGSTHSFVDPYVAKKAQLPTHDGKMLTVMGFRSSLVHYELEGIQFMTKIF
jgi:predicted aspartyl protease